MVGSCSQRVKVIECDIASTNKDEGNDVPIDAPGQAIDVSIILLKGVYPYDYMGGFDKLQEEALNNTLTCGGVSQVD